MYTACNLGFMLCCACNARVVCMQYGVHACNLGCMHALLGVCMHAVWGVCCALHAGARVCVESL